MNTDWTITDRLACCAEELLADIVWLDTPDAGRKQARLQALADDAVLHAADVLLTTAANTLHERVWQWACQ